MLSEIKKFNSQKLKILASILLSSSIRFSGTTLNATEFSSLNENIPNISNIKTGIKNQYSAIDINNLSDEDKIIFYQNNYPDIFNQSLIQREKQYKNEYREDYQTISVINKIFREKPYLKNEFNKFENNNNNNNIDNIPSEINISNLSQLEKEMLSFLISKDFNFKNELVKHKNDIINQYTLTNVWYKYLLKEGYISTNNNENNIQNNNEQLNI